MGVYPCPARTAPSTAFPPADPQQNWGFSPLSNKFCTLSKGKYKRGVFSCAKCICSLFWAPSWRGSHGRGWVPAGLAPRWQHLNEPGVLSGVVPAPGASLGAAAPLPTGHHRPPAPLHRQPHRHLRVRPHGRGHHRLGFGGKVSVTSPPACGGGVSKTRRNKGVFSFPLEQLKKWQLF